MIRASSSSVSATSRGSFLLSLSLSLFVEPNLEHVCSRVRYSERKPTPSPENSEQVPPSRFARSCASSLGADLPSLEARLALRALGLRCARSSAQEARRGARVDEAIQGVAAAVLADQEAAIRRRRGGVSTLFLYRCEGS